MEIIFPGGLLFRHSAGGHQVVFPMKSRSEILKLVQAKIRLRHFAFSTEQAYCHWAGRYYATHSREQIDALRQLMSHVSLETTAGYRHPVVEAATNPLDDLLDQT